MPPPAPAAAAEPRSGPLASPGFVAALLRAWRVVGLATIALLIAIRWLRYADWTGRAPFDGWFRELMVLDVQAFVWPWVYTTLKLDILLIAAAVVLIGFHRRLRARLVERVDGTWGLTDVAAALLVALMLWCHYLFDLNVTVAKTCAASLLLVSLVRSRLPRMGTWVVVGVALLAAVAVAGDGSERLALLAWAAVLGLAVASWHRMRARDLGLLLVAAVMPINLMTAALPLVLPLHEGRWMGDGLAYGFCEVPGRGTAFATIPVCDSVNADLEDCKDGAVVEYDLATRARVAAYHYFSPDFHGRLELIECLDDEVQVAVQAAMIHRQPVVQSTLAFPVADPTVFNPMMVGPGVGITIGYDRAHDAVFYTAEYNHRVVRFDRRNDKLDEVPEADIGRRWIQPITMDVHSGAAVLYTESIHAARNRVYVAEWMQGRYAHAVDLTTLRVVHRYDVGGGGALGVTVDPERDRLIVSSVWGLEVFDLKTDALIARRRLGFGNRPAIVDAARNRIYVGSTVEGKIRILDRDTFAVLGQIPIGMGTRFAHLTRDGRSLLASSARAHYDFDAGRL